MEDDDFAKVECELQKQIQQSRLQQVHHKVAAWQGGMDEQLMANQPLDDSDDEDNEEDNYGLCTSHSEVSSMDASFSSGVTTKSGTTTATGMSSFSPGSTAHSPREGASSQRTAGSSQTSKVRPNKSKAAENIMIAAIVFVCFTSVRSDSAYQYEEIQVDLEIEDPLWFHKSEDPVLICTVHSMEWTINWRHGDLFIGFGGDPVGMDRSLYNITSETIDNSVRQERLHVSSSIIHSSLEEHIFFLCENQGFKSPNVYLQIPVPERPIDMAESEITVTTNWPEDQSSTSSQVRGDDESVSYYDKPKTSVNHASKIWWISATPAIICIMVLGFTLWKLWNNRKNKKGSTHKKERDQDVEQEGKTLMPPSSTDHDDQGDLRDVIVSMPN